MRSRSLVLQATVLAVAVGAIAAAPAAALTLLTRGKTASFDHDPATGSGTGRLKPVVSVIRVILC